MSADASFRDLIDRVRAGDARAAEELVRRYEPTIRLVVRRRLTDPELRRLLDSMDVCQSILGTFFEAARAGQFDLSDPEHLLKLLAAMARNKVTSYARKQRAARRTAPPARKQAGLQEPVDPGPSPSDRAVTDELLDRFRQRLSAEERRIVDLYALGHSWTEIAAQVGGSPDGRRMQFSRVIARVKPELGLEE